MRNVHQLFLALSRLWSSTTLDTSSLWSLEVRSWDPFVVDGLSTGRSGWAVSTVNVTTSIDFLRNGGSFTKTTSLLLWEVWSNPDVVEEVTNRTGAAKEEEVQEDASPLSVYEWDGLCCRVTYI